MLVVHKDDDLEDVTEEVQAGTHHIPYICCIVADALQGAFLWSSNCCSLFNFILFRMISSDHNYTVAHRHCQVEEESGDGSPRCDGARLYFGCIGGPAAVFERGVQAPHPSLPRQHR